MQPMTQKRADDFLQNYDHLVELVEDYELRGGTHFYFLSDERIIKINRRKAVIVNSDNHLLWCLTEFTQ